MYFQKVVGGPTLIDQFKNEIVRQYNINESTDKHFVRKMDSDTYKTSLVEATLLEYNALVTDAGAALGKGIAIGGTDALFYGDLGREIIKSHGDITKVKEYKAIKVMISIAKTTCNSTPKTPETDKFVDNLHIIDTLIASITKNKDLFEKVIAKESKLPNNTLKFGSMLYVSLVVLVTTTFQSLFSSSIEAVFDENVPNGNVKSFYFTYKGDLEENFEQLSLHLEAFNNGTYRNIFNELLHENLTLKEQYAFSRPLINKSNLMESLHDSNSKILNESLADLAVAFITSNSLTDALLIPIYLIRYMVYLFKYTAITLTQINDNINKSLGIIKDNNLSKEEFTDYKESNAVDNNDLDQKSTKAVSDTDGAVRKDKEVLEKQQQSSSNTIII